jgi:polysaccharide export outer membrane protein
MNFFACVFLSVFLALGAGCATRHGKPAPLAAATPVAAPAPPPATYRLQPGDVLLISVWKEQDLQAEVLIRPDGGVSFPLAGDVSAAGRTVDEVRADVATRIQHYIPDAAVTVSLKTPGGNKVYVVGKVNRPGEFPLNRPIDVMQAISLAGGTTTFANVDGIRILRRTGDKITTLPFRYSQVARGKHLDQDVQLKSGDTVVVP